MRIDWWTLGLQAVNALILVWVLARFLFRPIANILSERQAAADRIVAEADAAKAAAESERAKALAETTRLTAGRDAVLKAAADDAAKHKDALLAAAHAEADRLRAEANAEIARARAAAEDAAEERASVLAVDISSKLFERLPESARIAGFIDGLADGVATLQAEVRDGLGADGAPLHVTAARALTDEERTLCRNALSKTLGRDVAIEVTVSPDLIAGLELNDAHAEVRNSFKADLERLEANLTRHDDASS
jgi:F-type H+-transporting ATPase subunit b